MTTRLLVSVRDRVEALDALAAGADWIDLKEPRRGALGPVDAIVMREVAAAIGARVPVSTARPRRVARWSRGSRPSARHPIGEVRSRRLRRPRIGPHDLPRPRRLPAGCGTVAVIYADGELAAAPPSADVLRHAVRCGCRAVLVDTCARMQAACWIIGPSRNARPRDAIARARAVGRTGRIAHGRRDRAAAAACARLCRGAQAPCVPNRAPAGSAAKKFAALAELVHGPNLVGNHFTEQRRAGTVHGQATTERRS